MKMNKNEKIIILNYVKNKIENKNGNIFKSFNKTKRILSILNILTFLTSLYCFYISSSIMFNNKMQVIMVLCISLIPSLLILLNEFIKSLIKNYFLDKKISFSHEEILEISKFMSRDSLDKFLSSEQLSLEEWISKIENVNKEDSLKKSQKNILKKEYLDSIYN